MDYVCLFPLLRGTEVLTISAHPCGHTLLESAVLASVPIYPLNGALLVLGAGPVVDLLLDGPAEESLKYCQY